MSRNGSRFHGLLHDRHAEGCDEHEFSTVRPVPFGSGIAIIYSVWCVECGAADWDYVDLIEPDPEVYAR